MPTAHDQRMPPIDHRQPIAGRSEVPAPRSRPSRTLLWWLTLGYSAFVIYGSLVPLHFRRQPLDKAWEYFQRIPYLDLGIGSRADWVANILLFVPLAFLWLGLLWPRRSRIAQAIVSGVVLLGGVGLSAAIEFTQIFFPPRTVSLNDIIAETLGTIIGIVLWWSTGRRVMAWLAGWSEAHTPTGTTRASSIRLSFPGVRLQRPPFGSDDQRCRDLPQMAGGQGAAGAVQRPLRLRCPTRLCLARGYRDLDPGSLLVEAFVVALRQKDRAVRTCVRHDHRDSSVVRLLAGHFHHRRTHGGLRWPDRRRARGVAATGQG